MSTLTVQLGERSYPIYVQQDALSALELFTSHIKSKNVVIVTNDTVNPLYAEGVKQLLEDFDVSTVSIQDGEQYKTLATFESITAQLLANKAARDTTLIAIGGGVVGDITGFVAACYQRGIPFIQVPTTLLSQVDSSVGGKTAVNHALGKNMIGAFYQPKAVIIDTDSLKTLPKKEFAAGMAEVIKYGVIYDADFFHWLESNVDRIKALETDAIAHIVTRCCQIKADIVAQDEKESGIRALLNLGHTFGHAIEAEMGYGLWLHGEAVAVGIVLASEVALAKEWLKASEVRRIESLLKAFDLPCSKPETMNYEQFMQHMRHDKKVEEGAIRFVIPNAIGSATVTSNVNDDILQKLLN